MTKKSKPSARLRRSEEYVKHSATGQGLYVISPNEFPTGGIVVGALNHLAMMRSLLRRFMDNKSLAYVAASGRRGGLER